MVNMPMLAATDLLGKMAATRKAYLYIRGRMPQMVTTMRPSIWPAFMRPKMSLMLSSVSML